MTKEQVSASLVKLVADTVRRVRDSIKNGKFGALQLPAELSLVIAITKPQ